MNNNTGSPSLFGQCLLFVVMLFPALFIVALISICVKSNKRKTNSKKNTAPAQTSLSTQNTKSTYNDIGTTARKLSCDEKALLFLQNDEIMSVVHFEICDPYNKNMLFEDSEAVFFHHAHKYAKDHNMELISKVRIADVIFVPNTEQYKYNENLAFSIEKKHFDFVLCRRKSNVNGDIADNLVPFLVIEIDGTSHRVPERIIRDDLVDKLIQRVNQHGNKIDIIHIRRRSLDDIDTQWQTIRYKFGGRETVKGEWLTIEELLDEYTNSELHG